MLPKVRIGLLCCLIPAVPTLAQTGAPSWGYYYPGQPPVYPAYVPYGYPPAPFVPQVPPPAPAPAVSQGAASAGTQVGTPVGTPPGPQAADSRAQNGRQPARPESLPARDALPAAFRIQESRLGKVLANSQALTLYRSLQDGDGVSACPDQCGSLWQPFLIADADRPAAPFGAVQRADGARQWSYAGHPLYLWLGDQRAGDVTGDGVEGLWQAVRITPE